MTLSDILTELDQKEYEEFCLNASFNVWQEVNIYGNENGEDDEQVC